MVKAKEHSGYLRKRVVACHDKGEGYNNFFKKLSLPKSTVQAIIKKHNSHGHIKNIEGRGRKKLLSARAERNIIYVNQHLRVTAGDIAGTQCKLKINVSKQKVARVLKRTGLKHVAQKRHN